MSRTKLQRLVAVLLAVLMLVPMTGVASAADSGSESSGSSISLAEINEILNAINYTDYKQLYAGVSRGETTIVIPGTEYDPNGTTATVEIVENYLDREGSSLSIGETGVVTWKVNVPKDGMYSIRINYAQVTRDKANSNSIERVLYINGSVPFAEARSLVMKKNWVIEYYGGVPGQFKPDSEGNHIRPSQIESPEWMSWQVRDTDGYYANPFEFYFKAGENTITLESVRESVVIESIELVPYKDLLTYEEYLAAHAGASDVEGVSPVIVEGENILATSDVTIYPINDRVSAITYPQRPDALLLNTVGGEEWATSGQWIEYKVKVEKSGFYNIALRFKQSWQSGLDVARRIYIDGEVPFEEANGFVFGFDNSWQSTLLTDGEQTYKFYLEEGEHVIRLEVTLGAFGSIVQSVSDTLNEVNACYLEILKLTGTSPDKNQDYKFESVIPETLKTMLLCSNELKAAVEAIGEKSENTATLEQLYMILWDMVNDSDLIATKLKNLKSYLGTLGTWLSTAKNQPLMIDYISIQPVSEEAPKADANFFESIWYQLRLFVASFYVDYNNFGASEELPPEDTIEVWVVLNREKAQIIRNLAQNNFTPDAGVGVNLKLVAGGTLLPSVLAGVGPDVSLFEGDPLEYAIRDAVEPLNGYEGFDEVCERYVPEALTPVTLYGQTYGLPDSMTFTMLFYRKDILADLGLEIPKTWDDLVAMIPTLMANNMHLGMYNDSLIFQYQNGGELWADDGMRINYDSMTALEAFETLCGFYKNYSLDYQYDFANRFRTGEMPIGIAQYTVCNQLSVFASELSGLWGFTTLPGTAQEDGSINYDSMLTVTSCMMLKDSDKKEHAWKFMSWYTGSDFQISYSNEVVATMGTAEKHNTANVEALSELPWSAEEYQALNDQMHNLSAVTRYPGTYILTRYVNFAFLDVYNNNADAATSLLSHVNTINKEINRKRTEFGLEILDIGTTLAEKRVGQALTLMTEGELKTFEGWLYTLSESARAEQSAFVEALTLAAEQVSLSKVPDEALETLTALAKEAQEYATREDISVADRDGMQLVASYLATAVKALQSYRK